MKAQNNIAKKLQAFSQMFLKLRKHFNPWSSYCLALLAFWVASFPTMSRQKITSWLASAATRVIISIMLSTVIDLGHALIQHNILI